MFKWLYGFDSDEPAALHEIVEHSAHGVVFWSCTCDQWRYHGKTNYSYDEREEDANDSFDQHHKRMKEAINGPARGKLYSTEM